MTDITGHINIWQKLHLDFDLPFTMAGFTATSTHVETKSSQFVATDFRVGCFCENMTDLIKNLGICGRVRARSSANWTLINQTDALHLRGDANIVYFAWN